VKLVLSVKKKKTCS